ncbi:MAG: C40 family peptidase [Thermoanaerobaculia bacterium]
MNRKPFKAMVVAFALLAVAAFAQPVPAQVAITVPVADMHSRASAESDVVSQALFGSGALLLESDYGWVKVLTEDAYEGWIRETELRRVAAPYAASGPTVMVESLFASLYNEPDIEKHAPLLTIPYGSKLEVTGRTDTPDGPFHSVRLPGGPTAWVQSGDVASPGEPLSIDATIALAKRFLGLPYRWGGTSSYGFDCSGFTQMLMRRRGVSMPRDTRPMARWDGLAPVEREALKPGDLIFFGKTKDRINHTGMYIGNGEFIHATRRFRPMVQIGVLDHAPWTNEYITARRAK